MRTTSGRRTARWRSSRGRARSSSSRWTATSPRTSSRRRWNSPSARRSRSTRSSGTRSGGGTGPAQGPPWRTRSGTPNQGVLSTSAELVPLASPTFESGPPSPTAIELARVVDRGIRESKTVNVEKLCITPKEKVWIMFIDIHALDYDGNLFDAASYGALSALSCAKVPASKIGKEDYPLPLEHWPISVTAAKIGGTIMVDP